MDRSQGRRKGRMPPDTGRRRRQNGSNGESSGGPITDIFTYVEAAELSTIPPTKRNILRCIGITFSLFCPRPRGIPGHSENQNQDRQGRHRQKRNTGANGPKLSRIFRMYTFPSIFPPRRQRKSSICSFICLSSQVSRCILAAPTFERIFEDNYRLRWLAQNQKCRH